MDWKELADIVRTLGFPVAVACYLLWRGDKLLDYQKLLDAMKGVKDDLDEIKELLRK